MASISQANQMAGAKNGPKGTRRPQQFRFRKHSLRLRDDVGSRHLLSGFEVVVQ